MQNKAIQVIKQPKSYLYIGIALICAGIAMGVFALTISAEILTDSSLEGRLIISSLCFGVVLLAIWIVVYQINWKVEIYDSYFIYQNVFRRRKTYQYDEVREMHTRASIIYYSLNGKRILLVSYLQPDCEALSTAIWLYRSQKKHPTE